MEYLPCNLFNLFHITSFKKYFLDKEGGRYSLHIEYSDSCRKIDKGK